MRRIHVVGTSGSGKTTFAARLAERLGVSHVELDALYWGPHWSEADTATFRARVRTAIAGDAWVVDGNYAAVRNLIWKRADTVVWLDYSLPVVLSRVVGRSARRILSGEELWAGNRETLRKTLGRDSIILWSLTTFRRRRREYPARFAARPDLRVVRLRSPRDSRRWLTAVGPEALD